MTRQQRKAGLTAAGLNYVSSLRHAPKRRYALAYLSMAEQDAEKERDYQDTHQNDE